MASLQITGLPLPDAGNNSISFLEHMLYPPVKSWLMINPLYKANSAVCTVWDSFNPDSFSHEVEPSFHWQQICQSTVLLWVTGLPCNVICWSDREMALLSFQESTSSSRSKYSFPSEWHWAYIDSAMTFAVNYVTLPPANST